MFCFFMSKVSIKLVLSHEPTHFPLNFEFWPSGGLKGLFCILAVVVEGPGGSAINVGGFLRFFA